MLLQLTEAGGPGPSSLCAPLPVGLGPRNASVHVTTLHPRREDVSAKECPNKLLTVATDLVQV